MANHKAKATNWNGEAIEVTFSMSTKDFERLCKKAHDTFHKDGKWTIRLDTIDEESVPNELRYG